MRVAALFFGLIAGLFALIAPIALKTDLMSPFLDLWKDNASEHLLGTIVWYAVPAAAVLGGLLALVVPGFAAVLLLAATVGWAGIAFSLSNMLDLQLIAPAFAAGLAAILAFVGGELQLRQRRERRRMRRAAAETLVDESEFEREAALRTDPLVVPREDVAPPKRAIPLTLDDVSVTEKPESVPPRWQDLDAQPVENRRGSDMWAEAIRPEAVPESEPELEQFPDLEPQRESGGGRRGFNWNDDDDPLGPRLDLRPTSGPRLEPRRPEPTFAPRLEPRNPDPLHELRPEARRTTPPPPPRPEPVPQQPPQPPLRDSDADNWPEPLMRRQMSESARQRPRRNAGLMASLAAVGAVLVLGLLLAGGYLAYRDGWVDRLIAMVQAPTPEQPPQSVASTGSDGKPVLTTLGTTAKPVSVGSGDGSPKVVVDAPELVIDTPVGEIPAPPLPEGGAPVVAPLEPAPVAVALADPQASYDDPFAYCRAVGTLDYVDSRYAGPAIVEAMTQALSLPKATSRDRIRWRCFESNVLACTSYAGPVCDSAPTLSEMREFCKSHPEMKQLLAPGGLWSCVGGKPRLPADASWPVDSRGFMPSGWVVVRPNVTPAG